VSDQEFKVWTECYNGPDDPFVIKELDARSAAVKFFERYHSAMDHLDEAEVFVKDQVGAITVWNAICEMEPVFSAYLKKTMVK
jgi:hypothetical protein